ncbi:MAG TPA: lysylphosphatidylglycerol synthase transmembrane domain-containing protein [Blastocatellia bacterium]|nr:lysylphosphatidylglycerol synthase transmembrane domain-containing protein [Blastocatellia bacterium]
MTKKAAVNAFHIASFLAGVALFIYLIKQTGLATLAQYVAMMGLGGSLLILALSAVRNCVRAASWYYSIEPSQRGVTFWTLMNAMLAGEAIKYLTATGPLVSEPAKAAMVRREVPLLQGFSSVFVENLIYYLTVFVFMFAGLPALVWLAEVPGDFKIAGFVLLLAIAIAVVVTWLAIRWESYILARGLEHLARLTARPGSEKSEPGQIESIASKVRRVEENLYSFYNRRRSAFYLIFCLNMGSHLINVVEVYVILALMKLPATLLNGFLVEAVTKVINLVFFFVPTRAGVYESGNALLLQALGMSAAAGVALAIIRKLRAFVWVGYGLGVIGVMMLNKKEELKIEN